LKAAFCRCQAPAAGTWILSAASGKENLGQLRPHLGSLPTAGTAPTWLTTPDHFELLASGDPYYYLAGRMIVQGLVDVSSCPAGGLLPNGYADACGLEKSPPILEEWQNQFDQRIIEVGGETGVPAQLMKNLFARKASFGRACSEYRMNSAWGRSPNKAWIRSSVEPGLLPALLLASALCRCLLARLPGLTVPDRAILRGALALQAKADCPDCPNGINLDDTYFTVSLFANMLRPTAPR